MHTLFPIVLLIPGQFDAPSSDARLRRAIRENTIARVGEQVRPLVETYGEAAVTALNGCSPGVVSQRPLRPAAAPASASAGVWPSRHGRCGTMPGGLSFH